MSGETTTATEDKIAGLEVELDRLSLEQTLRDFEVANARAVDLTQRLIGLSHEITSLREQLVAAQADARTRATGEPRPPRVDVVSTRPAGEPVASSWVLTTGPRWPAAHSSPRSSTEARRFVPGVHRVGRAACPS